MIKSICRACHHVRRTYDHSSSWRCIVPWSREQDPITGKTAKFDLCTRKNNGVCMHYRPKEKSFFSIFGRFIGDTKKMILCYTWRK